MTGGKVANKLLGAWRYVGTRINDTNWDRGANPKGMIYYAFTAVKDYIAYFGTYTVDEAAGTVTHHRQDSLRSARRNGDADRARRQAHARRRGDDAARSMPGDGGDLVRRYELNGDRLVLRAPNSTFEVTWERIT
jgi:hypothetical protein